MAIIDISRPIRPGMPVYPGDPETTMSTVVAPETGNDGWRVSALSMSLHAGTHVDAPRHFLAKGVGVDQLPLELFCGPVQVITAETLAELVLGSKITVERLLVKGGGTGAELAPETARALVRLGLCLVGTDQDSIGGAETHRILLEAGIPILENLDLEAVVPGSYGLMALPLNIPGAEAAPVRAILITDDPHPHRFF